jgi:hypothetical protein
LVVKCFNYDINSSGNVVIAALFWRETMSNNKIFIFNKNVNGEHSIIRDFIKKQCLEKVILADVDYIFMRLIYSRGRNKERIDGIDAIKKNPNEFTIVFYGGDEDTAVDLIDILDLYNRNNVGWIPDLFNTKDLINIVRRLRLGYF